VFFTRRQVGRPAIPFALAVLCLALPAAGQPAPAQRLFSETRPAMGSSFTVHFYAADAKQAAALMEAAFDEIERVEEMLSNYRPASELSRINRLAATQAVTTDSEMFALLERVLEHSRASGSAFDPTVGPLMRAWGFFRGQGRYPTTEELAKARATVGWQQVILDRETRTVRFSSPGVELDPGAFGKGYAVDRVIELLAEAGVTAALVDAASSTMRALGAPPGEKGWKIEVPRPKDRNQPLAMLALRDSALSTSGNYEKFFRLDGREYGHILDPRTGEPVQKMLQTTVTAPSGLESDILSTTVFVLGFDKGVTLLERVQGGSAIWVHAEPRGYKTIAWHWPGQYVSDGGWVKDLGRAAVKR
jgi:thiamine biosynthesis lipoprotein